MPHSVCKLTNAETAAISKVRWSKTNRNKKPSWR